MATDSQLKTIIKSIGKLPAFPKIAMRVLNLANDPESSVDDIVSAVQLDQALTSNCLRLCNSTYFGLKKEVSSLQHAVVYLGPENLVKIVLADCGGQVGLGEPQVGYGLQPGQLWKHSIATAIMSQLVAKKIGKEHSHELFTAALLHDVGKLVIDSFIADNLDAMLSLMMDGGLGMVEAEKEFFGIDHAEVGGLVAKLWNFPKPLIDAIRNHHQSISEIKNNELNTLTVLNNILFYAAEIYMSGVYDKGLVCRIDQRILNCFDLTQEDIVSIIKDYPVEMKKAEEFLQIPKT